MTVSKLPTEDFDCFDMEFGLGTNPKREKDENPRLIGVGTSVWGPPGPSTLTAVPSVAPTFTSRPWLAGDVRITANGLP